ncbi:MAG: hypothetical protein P1V20_10125 [Verrucomicrobiales bacterium]|nr:hypothetical protein [Verrucomicrobiales bacterium]
MSSFLKILGISFLFVVPVAAEGEREFFEKSGARMTKDSEGRIIKIQLSGKPPMTVPEFQKLGKLTHLQQLATNGPPAGDGGWGFLRDLKNLKQLTIWHGKEFSSLSPFCDLPIEGLTVGGCMGIRNLNKDEIRKQRDAVLTLRGLPNLQKLNLYHSPLTPDDSHLAHIAREFPKLQDLKLDFAAPRGSETSISPQGLRELKKLPLKILTIESTSTLTAEHMKAIAEIESLQSLLLDARRTDLDSAAVASLKEIRPGLEVVVAEAGSKAPPKQSLKN